jgi:tight adherence protein B
MADPAQNLAAGFAALSAAGLVCAMFYPVLVRKPLPLYRVLKEQQENKAESAHALRVHEITLKKVTENNRSQRTSWLDARLVASGLHLSQRGFIAVCLTITVILLALGVLGGISPAIMVGIAATGGGLLPLHWLAYLARRRHQQFLTGFGSAIDMVLRGAKSGLSVVDCLSIAADEADQRVRKEFAAIVAQLRAGVPLSEAMMRLTTLIPVPEVRFFALIMSMQSQTGGNLSNSLTNLARVLRDRQRLAAKVRIASAEVKVSAITVGALPFAVMGATMFASPDYISILWTSESGRKIMMFSAAWLMVGIWVLRRMARIEP